MKCNGCYRREHGAQERGRRCGAGMAAPGEGAKAGATRLKEKGRLGKGGADGKNASDRRGAFHARDTVSHI